MRLQRINIVYSLAYDYLCNNNYRLMILKRLSILNYKNIEQADLEFSPKVNCFIGQNGMGKTNLLDAIYYLSFCKSSSNPIDSQVMRHDSDFFVVQGLYESEQGTEEDIYCGMKRRQKKTFKRNKKAYQRFSEHVGFIPLVMVSPSDGELILGGSEERRRFMDVAISQHDKEYLAELINYDKALQQRNARRVFSLLRGKRWLVCTTHFVQNHCSIEDLEFAYDLIYKLARE